MTRKAERRPSGGMGGAQEIALGGGDNDRVDHGAVLRLSDERARWVEFALSLARDAYAGGYADGRADQAAEDDAEWSATVPARVPGGLPLAGLELLRWGPGGREHFGDPRPGDGYAEQVRRNARAAGLIPAGMVHLGGRALHGPGHTCTSACSAYRPGWYTFREAARIMATLPDCAGFRKEIADLVDRADEHEAAA